MATNRKRWVAALIVVALAAGAYFLWQKLESGSLPEGFASGNGRIEGTEIDIATKAPGRVNDILVREGDFVSAGQVLAQMDSCSSKHSSGKRRLSYAVRPSGSTPQRAWLSSVSPRKKRQPR